MHWQTRPGRSKCRGARIQLDSLRLPSCIPGEVHESSRMRTDIEQPARGCSSLREAVENRSKDEVLVIAFEFLLNPFWRPQLVVQQIEEPTERRETFRLRESAASTLTEPHSFARVLRKGRVLI